MSIPFDRAFAWIDGQNIYVLAPLSPAFEDDCRAIAGRNLNERGCNVFPIGTLIQVRDLCEKWNIEMPPFQTVECRFCQAQREIPARQTRFKCRTCGKFQGIRSHSENEIGASSEKIEVQSSSGPQKRALFEPSPDLSKVESSSASEGVGFSSASVADAQNVPPRPTNRSLKLGLVVVSCVALAAIIGVAIVLTDGATPTRAATNSQTTTTLSPAERHDRAVAAHHAEAVQAAQARHAARVAAQRAAHLAAVRTAQYDRIALGHSTAYIQGILNIEDSSIRWHWGHSTSYGPRLIGESTAGCDVEIDGRPSNAREIELICLPAGVSSARLLRQYKDLKGTVLWFSGTYAAAWLDARLSDALNNVSGGLLPDVDVHFHGIGSNDEFVSTGAINSLSVFITN